ncbi:hypothetical protein F5Y14DRAFT_457126 [Nemania sp. NC0429]|nr:hypothetical protein F5Y14DRAFT_457126 [Nemania sp. NC0429]
MPGMAEFVRVTNQSGCVIDAEVATSDDGKVGLWNTTRHADGAFLCQCRRNEVPSREILNDEAVCERLFQLFSDGVITMADLPHFFAGMKLGMLVRRVVKLAWDEEEKAWI